MKLYYEEKIVKLVPYIITKYFKFNKDWSNLYETTTTILLYHCLVSISFVGSSCWCPKDLLLFIFEKIDDMRMIFFRNRYMYICSKINIKGGNIFRNRFRLILFHLHLLFVALVFPQCSDVISDDRPQRVRSVQTWVEIAETGFCSFSTLIGKKSFVKAEKNPSRWN